MIAVLIVLIAGTVLPTAVSGLAPEAIAADGSDPLKTDVHHDHFHTHASLDWDAPTANDSPVVPPRDPVIVTLEAVPLDTDGLVALTWSAWAPETFSTGVLRFRLGEGLSPIAGEPVTRTLVTGGVPGAGVLVVEAQGNGPFMAAAELDAVFEDGFQFVGTGVTHFHFDESGFVPTPLVQTTAVDEVDSVSEEDGGEVGVMSHCKFTVRYRTSSGSSIPLSKRTLPILGLEVNARDASNNIVATGTTDENGEVGFDVATCNASYTFERRHIYKDGTTEKARGTNLNGGLYTGTTSSVTVQNGGYYGFLVSEAHSGSAYMHGQTVESYGKTKAAGYTIGTRVEVRWEQGEKPSSCGSCYFRGNPGTIYMNGSSEAEWNDRTLYHEYGHHVHYDLVGSAMPSSSYGNHKDCTNCHYWDSAHNTMGSAFLEGWANFYVGVIRDTASIGYGNLDTPNIGRADHTDLDCWGPFRECSVAAALWGAYKISTVSFWDVLDVMSRGKPVDIHRFYEKWSDYNKPAQASVRSAFEAVHIPAFGDGGTFTDAGNTLASATWIPHLSPGKGSLTYEPHQTSVDQRDYMQVWVNNGEQVTVTMTPPSGQDLDLYLYDPDGIQRSSSTRGGDAQEDVSYVAHKSGYWVFEVRKWSSYQGQYGYGVSFTNPNQLTGVTVTSVPSSVAPGQSFTVCWNVQGSGSISHTHIHWGTSSGSYPQSTAVQTGTAPQSFCGSITAPSSGTVYLVAHAQGPSNSIFSSQHQVTVQTGLTGVVVTSVPSTVLPLGNIQVCWNVQGSGSISHTHIHWGTSSGSYPQSTTVQTGTAPQSFCGNFQAPLIGTVYLQAHAQGPNGHFYSSQYQVNVGI